MMPKDKEKKNIWFYKMAFSQESNIKMKRSKNQTKYWQHASELREIRENKKISLTNSETSEKFYQD